AGQPQDFHIFPFAAAAVRRVNEAGWAAVLVTNQAGVARGFFPEANVGILHRMLQDHLAAAGARLDGLYYCPHHPEGSVPGFGGPCDCRKPKPGMLRQAERELQLDLGRSWVVGDRRLDAVLAHAVGARAVLVRTGYGPTDLASPTETPEERPEHVADDALQAVEWILAQDMAQDTARELP
ncbi:MAG: D-glycero-alpha-D-manno-heptose-1,7-bisphosphate 7-phosphatase, partial [Terriglobales bacterium]